MFKTYLLRIQRTPTYLLNFSYVRIHYRHVAEIQIFEKTYLIVIKDETGLKILYWQKDVIFRELFYFLKVILLSFIFVWVLLIFINLKIVFWGDNSYYPIKFNIFLYIIPCNTAIFNQNPQNFIIS